MTSAGDLSQFWIGEFQARPHGIVAGPDGNLWFTERENNSIGKISTDGKVSHFSILGPSGDETEPVSIVVGPDGNLWFTECSANKVGRITTTGEVSAYAIPTANSRPSGLAIGPDGALWFTEEGNAIGRMSL